MPKQLIAKTLLCKNTEFLETEGYKFSKDSSSHEIFTFKKDLEKHRIVLSYSIDGRGSYGIFGHLKLIYKDLTETLFRLVKNSPLQDSYDLNNSSNVWFGVGISSEVRRYSDDKQIYRCSNDEETKNLSYIFFNQVKSAEHNFIRPHMEIMLTLKEFRKSSHALWPGQVKDFLEHLVAYSVENRDVEMLHYAFKRADEVCAKIPLEAKPVELLTILKERTGKLDFVKNAVARDTITVEL